MFTHRKLRLALATATAVSLTGGLLVLATQTATAATPAKYADDFNGDGFRDYAVGWAGEVTVTKHVTGVPEGYAWEFPLTISPAEGVLPQAEQTVSGTGDVPG